MTIRATALGSIAALGVLLTTVGCTPQQDLDPDGRCLKWQMAVTAEVNPSSTTAKPSWDLTFQDTSKAACVFGGVPVVRLLGTNSKQGVGVVARAVSEEWAVQLAPGDVAYARIALDPIASTSCTPAAVRSLRVTAPHVAGGSFLVKVPAKFVGCAGTQKVALVGQVTAKRSK